jgi:hypothetical protein
MRPEAIMYFGDHIEENLFRTADGHLHETLAAAQDHRRRSFAELRRDHAAARVINGVQIGEGGSETWEVVDPAQGDLASYDAFVWHDSTTGLNHRTESLAEAIAFDAEQGKILVRIEAAVTAARIAVSDSKGAVFAPLAMGGAGGLRAGGSPADRLAHWLDGMETACLTGMRQLDDIEAWSARAEAEMTPLSGRTPPALRAALTEWPLVSAPMAEAFTGASRAAVQRNLAWMEEKGLVREMTGQGRYRMWRAAN